MLDIRVFVKNISAENFWEIGKTIPPVQIATNLNVVGINKKSEEMLEVPFVFTINYTPAVAQISLKGISLVKGLKDELEKIIRGHKEKQPPPPFILQSISNVVFLETVILCRSLNIPPPIPLPKIPTETKKKRSEPTYRS
ncbi:hypothetical protein AC477_00360 [miscellaneous Crenarchaeota group-1 archaeon SG8-32-1]|uniref:Uncharacterized protein n=1 Tax=miscellaneous Crenarchaeota group-1 archaeon SG8-32-1 TaxID=1685124 RepID=A0A0M0C172_9ARCH|nr:MAG: hypothetical protein AC477_00360 [miscellaneous Crenarchaeota group-1 archaeon SG8-32-1]